jgi:putative ABC transport system substrate-binding protein
MRRREFISVIVGATAWPFAAMAQEPGRTYRLGPLAPFPREAPFYIKGGPFFQELRNNGFIEDKNLTVEYRDYSLHGDLVSQYAAELVNAQVDVIVAGGGMAVRAAQKATKTIPIVGVADDMVGEGLVPSMARPSGNTTGFSILATELDGKRQEILIEALPTLRRMAALADSSTLSEMKARALQDAARARRIDLDILWIGKGEEIAAAIDKAQQSGAAALNVFSSPMLHSNSKLIMERAAALRMPAIYQWPEMAEEGGFAAYGPRLGSGEFPERLARMIVKVFRGVKPADIPVEQPTKFELVINLKTAKAMGVMVPEALLARADKVIE